MLVESWGPKSERWVGARMGPRSWSADGSFQVSRCGVEPRLAQPRSIWTQGGIYEMVSVQLGQ